MSQLDLKEMRLRETLAALESVKAGRTVTADQVFAWLRSWGDGNPRPRPRPNMSLPNAQYSLDVREVRKWNN